MKVFLLSVIALAGCANSSGVIAIADNSYVVTGQSDIGANKSVLARQVAIDSANVLCAKTLRYPVLIKEINEDVGHDTIFENRGATRITFKCVDSAR